VKKYINQVVEIIYMDRNGQITQRSIHIHVIRNGLIRATCLQTGAPRAFRTEQILALCPVEKTSKSLGKQPMRLSVHQPEDFPSNYSNHLESYPSNPPVNYPIKNPANRPAKGGSHYAS